MLSNCVYRIKVGVLILVLSVVVGLHACRHLAQRCIIDFYNINDFALNAL